MLQVFSPGFKKGMEKILQKGALFTLVCQIKGHFTRLVKSNKKGIYKDSLQ